MVDFTQFNNKLAQSVKQFENLDFLESFKTVQDEFQTVAESAFNNAEDFIEGETKGGIQAIESAASDLVDKVKILEPQIAKATKEIADEIPAMKEAISSSDITNLEKVFVAATTGDTAIDLDDIYPDNQSTVETAEEMLFDITTTANLEGVYKSLNNAVENLNNTDLLKVLEKIKPGDISGKGDFNPLEMMTEFENNVQSNTFQKSLTAAVDRFNNSLGGLQKAGVFVAQLESFQSAFSNSIFSAIPNFTGNMEELLVAFSDGNAQLCRSLVIKDISFSDDLTAVLDENNIKVDLSSVEGVQDTVTKANALNLPLALTRELDNLQSIIDSIEKLFPNILPTPGSFLQTPKVVADPTTDTVTMAGGKTSKGTVDNLNVILNSEEDVVSYIKSTEREITSAVVDWTGTFNDQHLNATSINELYLNNEREGIPYHFVIRKDGKIETGLPLSSKGKYKENYNDLSMGIVFVAGYNSATPSNPSEYPGELTAQSITSSQMKAFRTLMSGFYTAIPLGQAYGYYELYESRETVAKSGPGFSVSEFVTKSPFHKGNLGDVVENKKFYTIDELSNLLQKAIEGID